MRNFVVRRIHMKICKMRNSLHVQSYDLYNTNCEFSSNDNDQIIYMSEICCTLHFYDLYKSLSDFLAWRQIWYNCFFNICSNKFSILLVVFRQEVNKVMRWFFVRFKIDCIFCDLLRDRQVCCSFNSWLNDLHFSCRCLCFRFSIWLNLYEFIVQNTFHSKSFSRYEILVRIQEKFYSDYKS